ncbi:FAD/NAD(P)-binding domain-containing protein [Paxillus ammoniavirescens]|nr:FAD/NAD(P)-binding domain-containing protein [Paxillus ammoniavirescens]
MSTDELNVRTVAVLGGSYGGYRAAQVLAAGLPNGWRVVLVDRNSHFNHVYNLPRYAVLPGHEHKAFIPYDNLFNNPSFSSPSLRGHTRIHATITTLHPHHITYIPHQLTSTPDSPPPLQKAEDKDQEQSLHFDYAIYALGSHLPSPIDLWGFRDANLKSFSSTPDSAHLNFGEVHDEGDPKNYQPDGDARPPISRPIDCATHSEPCKNPLHRYTGTKLEGVSLLRSRQRKIEEARNVVVVGGGALGIQFASDLAAIHPRKRVTLLHSRSRLLPKFDEALGDEVLQGLQELGVHVILGERLDMSSLKDGGGTGTGTGGTRSARTMKGRELKADLLLLCTGQTPNTSLLHSMDPGTINPESGMVRVARSMQVLSVAEKADDDTDCGGSGPKAEGQLSPMPSSPRTLCGTVPPSPVETLVEFGSLATLSSECPAKPEFMVESETESSHEPRLRIYPQLFAIGDAADAFGAIKAGHTAYYQGEVAARNIVRLIKREDAAVAITEGLLRGLVIGEGAEKAREVGGERNEEEVEEDLELEEYTPGPPMIRVSLGLTKSAYEVAGVVGTKDDGTEDLGAAMMWSSYGYRDVDEEGMWR